MSAQRISPHDAHEALERGEALLVCAYDDPAKCEKYHLDGSIDLADLQSRPEFMEEGQKLIFYCA